MCVLVKYNSCICTGKTQDNKNRLKDDAFVYNKERYAQSVHFAWADCSHCLGTSFLLLAQVVLIALMCIEQISL